MAISEEHIMSDKKLSRDDLFLLMKSYENSVQQNTILLTQQQKMLEQQGTILDKQGQVCTSIQSVLDKLTTCGENTNHIEDSIIKTINSFGSAISLETEKVSTAMTSAIDAQTTKIVEYRAGCISDHAGISKNALSNHSNINLRLYGLFALLGGIIITLISMVIDSNEKIDIIYKIANHLGLS